MFVATPIIRLTRPGLDVLLAILNTVLGLFWLGAGAWLWRFALRKAKRGRKRIRDRTPREFGHFLRSREWTSCEARSGANELSTRSVRMTCMNNVAADALRVLPRGCGYGMLIALLTVITSSILGVVLDDGWSAYTEAILNTVAVLFYIGLPALVLGFSVGLVVTLFAFFVFAVMQHAGAATTPSRWTAAILAAIGTIWPSVYFVSMLNVYSWTTAIVVASSAAGTAILGQRSLRRLVTES